MHIHTQNTTKPKKLIYPGQKPELPELSKWLHNFLRTALYSSYPEAMPDITAARDKVLWIRIKFSVSILNFSLFISHM